MEMHQVRSFLAVATHLNFTRAAAALRVAQPSLTRAVLKLEAELGGPLFRRERSNTHLTELGRMMLPHLRASHAAAETANEQARRLRRREVGALSLGVSTGVEPRLPAALLAATAARIARLDVTVEVAAGETIERGLMTGEFDAAIVVPAQAVNDRFDLREIASDDLVVAFAPGHRFAERDRVPIAALDGEPLVAHGGCDSNATAADAMAGLGLCRLVHHRSNDPGWVAGLVRNGLGCALVPSSVAEAQSLDFRAVEGLELRHRTVLATVAGRRHSAALMALIREIDRRPLRESRSVG